MLLRVARGRVAFDRRVPAEHWRARAFEGTKIDGPWRTSPSDQGMVNSCGPSCEAAPTASTSTAMNPISRHMSMLIGAICRPSSGCTPSASRGTSRFRPRSCSGFNGWPTNIKQSSWRRGMGILALAADERVVDVKFTKDTLSVDLRDGRTITVPLVWYPRLFNATVAQRKNWRVAGGGYGIHWPDIDEDLSTEGLLRGAPAPRPRQLDESGHRKKGRH